MYERSWTDCVLDNSDVVVLPWKRIFRNINFGWSHKAVIISILYAGYVSTKISRIQYRTMQERWLEEVETRDMRFEVLREIKWSHISGYEARLDELRSSNWSEKLVELKTLEGNSFRKNERMQNMKGTEKEGSLKGYWCCKMIIYASFWWCTTVKTES